MGNYGCLPDRLAFEAGNLRGTLGGTMGELMPIVVGAPPGVRSEINAGRTAPGAMA